MLADRVIVLDFETTGLHPEEGDRVTEVAALKVQGGRIVGSFTSLVNCGVAIPAYISKFTGITQQMIDAAPEPALVFRKLLQFIGHHPVLAHNAIFDRRFLQSECRRLGLAGSDSLPEFICSVGIARRMFPELKSHALGALAAHLGLAFTPNIHRATVDAELTTKILFGVCDILRRRLRLPSIDLDVLRRVAGASAETEELAVASAA